MKEKYIEQLKNGICKPTPEQELLKSILEKNRPELAEAIENNKELDSIKTNQAINEVINLLFQAKFETAKKYGNYISLSKDMMLELAKIAFDIAKYKNEPESMFELSNRFSLDNKRVVEAVLSKIFKLIQENKNNEASSLKKKHKKVISKEMLKNSGKKYFEKSMKFEDSQTERNYDKAFLIKEIFELDDKTIASFAETQFEYNMLNENFAQAAEIAKNFILPSEKLEKAVASEFKEKFYKFVEKFDNKEYSGKVKLEKNDPYKLAIEFINKYKLIDKTDKKRKKSTEYIEKIKNIGYSFLKKLRHSDEYKDVNLLTKLFFCSSILTDFKLSDISDETKLVECESIAANILNEINENIRSLNDAFDFHEMVIKIYRQAPKQKAAIKKIGIKIFEIYLKNNQLKPMHQIYNDLELELNDIFSSLKKKSLEFIESKKLDSFKKLNDLFKIIHKLNNNEDFLMKLFHIYRELIYNNELKEAIELTNTFRLSSQKKIEPIRPKLMELLIHNKDDEALNLIKVFKIKNNQILDILVNIYYRKTAKSSESGYNFRIKYNVSVMDIGLFTWFFTEVINIPFFRKTK